MNKFQRNGGYTVVLFLAFIAAVLLAGFSLYDNGTVASERIRMQNTADATVYSTVNVISRDMNFIAYTNRSMVANQVAIAQMVGLSSWTHMLDKAVVNLDKVMTFVQIVPYIGPVLKKITTVMKKFSNMAKKGVDGAAKAGITASDILIGILSKGQDAFQLATADMAIATYKGVSKANDKDIKTNLLISGAAFTNLIKSWNDNIERNRDPKVGGKKKDKRVRARFEEFANVVRDSRDPFSQSRSYFWFKWISVINLGILASKVSIQKKGGTDFMASRKGKKLRWEWTAMDTVSVWHYTKWWSVCGKLPPKPCKKSSNKEVVPMGWGAAHALSDKKKFFNYNKHKSKKQKKFYEQGNQTKLMNWKHWGNDYSWRNSKASKFGYWKDNKNNRANIKGLRTFYDIKSNVKKDTGPSMVALLNKNTSGLRVQETLDKTDAKYNRPDLFKIEEDGSVVNDTMYGLAKAETYFSRPRDLWKRADGYREYGNLYNPFWQTRLIDTTNKERIAAVAAANLLK